MTLEKYLENHTAHEGEEEEMPKLKPCPFCGAEAQHDYYPKSGCIAYCTWCGAEMRGFASPEEAAEAWNRRDG